MMLRDLLQVTPGDAELSASAKRARMRALARLDTGTPAPEWRWRTALAAAFSVIILIVAILWLRGSNSPAPPHTPAAQPLRVHLTLSDGTRVEWTFLEEFRL